MTQEVSAQTLLHTCMCQLGCFYAIKRNCTVLYCRCGRAGEEN